MVPWWIRSVTENWVVGDEVDVSAGNLIVVIGADSIVVGEDEVIGDSVESVISFLLSSFTTLFFGEALNIKLLV